MLGVAIGFVSGVLSGAFGIGGGIVTTPGIRLLMGAPALIAVGTPLPVIVPSAITGAISYGRRGLVDVRSGMALGLSGSLTAVAGAVFATRVGGDVVLLATSLLILYAAADTILQAHSHSRGASLYEQEDLAPVRPTLTRLVAVGLLTGVYSGFFGLGGGFVLVPLLTRWLHFPIKRAIATSLVAVCVLAVPGTIAHSILGNIDWAIAAVLAVGVVPGAIVGARLTLGARDQQVRIAFALMLVAAGIWLAATEITGMT
jgi:uncharacterized membrane protein YfcA